MEKEEFSFGRCVICKKDKALKNGVCAECSDSELPDFFKELFK